MKKLIMISFCALALSASELEIVSDKFEADEKRGITVFDGNVKIKHNKDSIKADRLIVTIDKNKKPIKYKAQGNAKFKLHIKQKIYEGQSNMMEYDSVSKKYNFVGNVILKELVENNKIIADRVNVDQQNGTYSVEGSKSKPAKFIFNIDDKK